MSGSSQQDPNRSKNESSNGTGEGADTALEAMIKKRQPRAEDDDQDVSTDTNQNKQE